MTPTTTTLVSSPNPSTFGQAVTLTPTVSATAATGKVTFYDGVTILGVRTLPGGQATLTAALLPSGSRSLKAYHAGDATFAASASGTVPQTVVAFPQNGFQAAVNYDVGNGPFSVALGDFNGDGRADLAVANGNSGNVSVLLGKGDGTFQAAVNYSAGDSTISVAVGEFNGDGVSDLAVANFRSNNASILLGVAISPVVSLSPISINFGNQAVGIPSAPQTVTVTNTGTISLTVTNIAKSGDFSQTNNCATVAVSASCTITVTFTPAVSGPRTGAIIITDNASGSPHLVRLFGAGISGSLGPRVSLSNLALNFGVQATSTTSAAKGVTLTNSGDSTLTVSSVSATGDFAQTNNCGSLSAGGGCTINVTFTPTTSGARTGRVTIVDNAAGSPHVIRLFGTGSSGSAPVISFSSVSVNFGNQANGTTSAARAVTVTNTGTATLNITNLAVSGEFAASGCLTSLAPGAACTLSITFTPTALGNRTGRVTLTDNAAGSPHVIRLFGKGT